MLKLKHLKRPGAKQRGLSIVEMMVGLTIGLIVVAAASQVVVTQLNDNRRLLVEMQLQQDLRAAADIITRELRRAGAWNAAENGIWSDEVGPGQQNGLRQVDPVVTGAEVGYSYVQTTGGTTGPFGFRLDAARIWTRFGDSWQELTDGRSIKVTGFTVRQLSDPALLLPCPKKCSDGTTDCWPTVKARLYEVQITAQAVSDPSVQRSIRSTVKLRNDLVGENSITSPVKACPL